MSPAITTLFLWPVWDRLAGWLSPDLVPRVQRWKDIQQGMTQQAKGSVNLAIWLFSLMAVGVAVFIILQTRRDRARRKVQEQLYFERKAAEKELEAGQVALLSRAIQASGLEQPYRLLDSYDIFIGVMTRFEEKIAFSEQEHRHYHQLIDEIKNKLGFNKIEQAVQLESSREIYQGQPMRLLLSSPEGQMEYLVSLVENDEKRMLLEASQVDLELLEGVRAETPLEVTFYRESDASYRFVTTLEAPPDREKRLIALRHPRQLERKQARQFSRMEVRFRFSFHHLPKKDFNPVEIDRNLEKCERLPVYAGDSEDISGGGIAFQTRKRTAKGDFLYLNFQMLSDEHNEPLLAEVVWSGKDKNAQEQNLWIVRARFYDITDKMRDGLMKFIYQMQRRNARRLKFAPKKR